MASRQLDERNPHGIRVVADRAPLRPEALKAFRRGSRKAVRLLNELVGKR